MNEQLVTGCTALTSSTLCYDPERLLRRELHRSCGVRMQYDRIALSVHISVLCMRKMDLACCRKIHTTHSRHNLPQRSLTSQPPSLWTQSSASDHPFPGFVTTPLASHSSGQLGPVIRFAPAVSGVLSGASPLHPNHPPCSS